MGRVYGPIILGTGVAAILGLNAWYWWSWIHQESIETSLQEYQCKLIDDQNHASAFGRRSYSVPLFGPAWTQTPCRVHLQFRSANGTGPWQGRGSTGWTWTYFEVENGWFNSQLL